LPGKADIEKEILSKENDRFVLHDSRGFEIGEEANLKVINDFISKRSKATNLRDKLHAIWLVILISFSRY
jgi:hypothetical protein